jgi:hypothetical protein
VWQQICALTGLPPVYSHQSKELLLSKSISHKTKTVQRRNTSRCTKPRPKILEAGRDPREKTAHGSPRSRADRKKAGRDPSVHARAGHYLQLRNLLPRFRCPCPDQTGHPRPLLPCMDRAGCGRCTRSSPGHRVRARDFPRALGLLAPRGVPVLPRHGHRACRAFPRWVGDAGEIRR